MSRMILMLCLLFATFAGAADVQAQPEPVSSEVEFAGKRWKLEEIGEGGERTFLGRQAFFLERAQLSLLNQVFSEGVIEFDLAAEEPSGFVGVNFRDDGNGTGEQFYVRFHQSRKPDSIQYLGQMNGLASWQLHAGPNDATAVDLGAGHWIPVRIVVREDSADIFVRDMKTPVLHISKLRTDNDSGGVTFFAFDRPGMVTGAYFSRLLIRPLKDAEGLAGSPREEPEPADSVIRSWQVSSPFSEEDLARSYELDQSLADSLSWQTAAVEDNGVLNIARYTRISPQTQTVLVKLDIEAKAATSRRLNFGYSDRVRIYVNGQQQFYGNAQWRSRDHRFLGTVGLHDALILHLQAGANEIVAAVSESFGGWGFIGQIEDQEEILINP